MTESIQLLRDYAERRDEQAFGELVRRYIDLVYSTALRRVNGDAHFAQDIAQKVFIDLAQKSKTLPREVVLGGWLYQHTCFTAAKALRTEHRRHAREMEAVTMSVQNNDADAAWRQVAPMLDEALNRLSKPDVNAIVLRFFEGQPLREVGRALGISEDAARMRVNRALEQLRRLLAEQGLKLSTAGLATMLADEVVAAAPIAVTRGITAAIVSGAVAASIPALSLSKTLLLMAKLKTKTLIIGGIAALALLDAGLIIYNSIQESKQRGQTESTATQAMVNATNRSRGFRAPVIAVSDATNLTALVARLRAMLHEPHPRREEIALGLSGAVSNLAKRFENQADLGRLLSQALENEPWPGKEEYQSYYTGFTNLIKSFGEHGEVAFRVLKEAVSEADADSNTEIYWRAIHGMGFLQRSVPGLVPYLWDIAGSRQVDEGHAALNSLSNLGFQPADLPALAELLIRDSQTAVPVIEQLLARDRDAAKPYLSAVEKLLDYPGVDLRFNAALALVKSEGRENPKVLDAIVAGLGDGFNMGRGLAVIRDIGPSAKSALPDLIKLAKSTSVTDYTPRGGSLVSFLPRQTDRLDLFRTIDGLDPNLMSQWPELDQALKDGEESQRWDAKWKSGDYTLPDLAAALRNPYQTSEAARRLQQLGPNALEAVPMLLDALAGPHRMNEKEQIVAAIRAIDPQVKIPRVESRVVTDALDAAQRVLQPGQEADDPLRRELSRTWMSLGNGATWWTERELAAFSSDLATKHPSAHRAFVAKLLGRDPRLKEVIEPAPVP